jgi:heme oxygenase
MSAPVTDTGDYLDRLNDQTRAEHEAIETALGLIRSDLTVASYRYVLERFHGFYGPVENALEDADNRESSGLSLKDHKNTAAGSRSTVPRCGVSVAASGLPGSTVLE